ncbi:MAG: DUF1573 domain-containing protein [Bacteroidales bacterium]|nr:DUF1573 domain-containing protein [Bacteroidales bacterium]MDD4218178.1 DUF1573 domain-containing protein [Bacteroidales bacterium]MDY0140594.1 DUF1573 domain-containing protein [Bacteroidales bacterium]
MRNIVILLGFIIALTLGSCKDSKNKTGGEYNIDNPANADNPNAEKDGLPKISFEETEFNFGTVIQGEKVIHNFVFTNTGKGNLIISNVKASCGCTVPKWTKEPIRPGQKGNVEIKFDSSGRDGKQTKTAKVYSNTNPNVTELVVRCEIIY